MGCLALFNKDCTTAEKQTASHRQLPRDLAVSTTSAPPLLLSKPASCIAVQRARILSA